MRNELIANHIVEGLTADHKEGNAINISGSFGSVLANGAPNAFVIKADMKGCGTHGDGPISCAGLNRLITIRRSVIESNSGIQVGASTDVLVEGSRIANTPPESTGLRRGESPIHVSGGAVGFVSRANSVAEPMPTPTNAARLL